MAVMEEHYECKAPFSIYTDTHIIIHMYMYIPCVPVWGLAAVAGTGYGSLSSSAVTGLAAAPAGSPAPGAAAGPHHQGISPPLVTASAAVGVTTNLQYMYKYW